MGQTATAETTTPAAPAAPAPSAPGGAGAPSGGSDQGGSAQKGPEGAPATGGRAEGSSAQPADAPAAPGTEGTGAASPGKPVQDPHVPWRKFREAQTELTNIRRQHATEVQKVNAQIASQQQELTQLRTVKADYDILEQLIDENPDLAEQLFQRAGNLRPRAGAQQPAAAQPDADSAAAKEVRELRSMFEAEKRARVNAAEAQRLDATDRELDGALTKLLTDHQLDASWLESAKDYVLATARRIPTLEMDEVPYVFAEWAKPLQTRLNNQLNTWRNGKLADASVLPPTPGSGPVVAGQGQRGALDRTTKSILEERLKQQLGWKNE